MAWMAAGTLLRPDGTPARRARFVVRALAPVPAGERTSVLWSATFLTDDDGGYEHPMASAEGLVIRVTAGHDVDFQATAPTEGTHHLLDLAPPPVPLTVGQYAELDGRLSALESGGGSGVTVTDNGDGSISITTTGGSDA